MTKFDDFLEWLEANPWIVLWVGVLALCGFFRGYIIGRSLLRFPLWGAVSW